MGGDQCAHTLLPQCETILGQEEAQQHQTIISCRRSIHLNGQELQLVLADEQAKSVCLFYWGNWDVLMRRSH